MITVSASNLRAGIRVFQEIGNLPPGLHADLYERHATLLRRGPSARWWAETVDDLFRWRANRPLTNALIHERGRAALPRLRRAWQHLPAAPADLGAVDWKQLAPLFDVATSIKPMATPSPVFASKLCHFMRPDLYVVVDRALVGLGGPYVDSWAACARAWDAARPRHAALMALLQRAVGGTLPPGYPYATKITELCVIGARAGR